MENILIIEDEEPIRELIKLNLALVGYNTLEARDGSEGLDIIGSEKIDLVLLDIMLPKLDGFAVCERLKKDNETKSIPIIMLTALKDLKDKIKSLEVGADDFISKPFENVELLARVKSLLKLKEYHDELERKSLELEKKNQSLIIIQQ